MGGTFYVPYLVIGMFLDPKSYHCHYFLRICGPRVCSSGCLIEGGYGAPLMESLVNKMVHPRRMCLLRYVTSSKAVSHYSYFPRKFAMCIDWLNRISLEPTSLWSILVENSSVWVWTVYRSMLKDYSTSR